jgi:hypothetical protein
MPVSAGARARTAVKLVAVSCRRCAKVLSAGNPPQVLLVSFKFSDSQPDSIVISIT